jgi:hypothetical protein
LPIVAINSGGSSWRYDAGDDDDDDDEEVAVEVEAEGYVNEGLLGFAEASG